MSQILTQHLPALESMKKYPAELFYKGNIDLLQKPKVSIIGSRRPNQYTRHYTYMLAQKLANAGFCIVSGAAMGVDAIAHLGATASSTIAVAASGLNIRYPAINKDLITSIENEGLVLSQFRSGLKPTNWSFVVRNELVVALGDILIVTEADLNSGSMKSVEYALEMKKEIYTLPHRIGESDGTNELVKKGLAKTIYSVDEFVAKFGVVAQTFNDPFLDFCASKPTFDHAVSLYGTKVYEAELEGRIKIENGIILV